MSQGELIGTVDKGDTFYFAVTERGLDGVQAGAFVPSHYDIIDYVTDTKISADIALTASTLGGLGGSLFYGNIDTSNASYIAGRNYGILVKTATGDPTSYVLKSFTVTKSGAQNEWIRNDIENVVFPRLKRILGLLGENVMLDKFTYDDSHNITGLRIRLFSDTSSAQTATPDIDDTDLPEVGEVETFRVDQDIDIPRSVRTKHLSYPDVDADDSDVTDNQGTDPVNAPGNTGNFPT